MKTFAPLSKVQYGLYVECVAHQGEACYNLPYLYVLDGTLDEEKLCRAIETAVAAHPTLFTRIELNDQGDPLQTVDDTETFKLNVEYIENLGLEGKSFNSQLSTLNYLIVPFNIYEDRLFHIRLLRDKEHFYFFLDIHHIIGDGTTLKVMLADLEKAYAGEALEPEAMTMAEVALAEEALRKTSAFEEGKQWYAQNFDCSDCYTPLMPDLDDPVHSEASMVRTLGIDMARVDQFCKDNGIFKSNFFTTAYSFLLARYNNEQESLFTTIYNGRTDKRFLHSVGMTVKTLPVYAKFDNETKVLDYLKAGQDQMGGVRKHEAYAFSDVVNDLGLQSNTMFAWHGMMFADEQLCGKPMKTIRLCNSTLEASLYLKAFILNGKYQIKAEYNSNEYSEALISQFLESYEAVVEGFLTKEYLRDVNITTTSQIVLLDSFNDTDRPYDDTQTVVSLFRRQVKATPDAEAVVFKDHRYTYAQVDEISDRLAGYIASKGLGVGDAVSIIIPRCEWMVIASFGILKAGCAYQPLDPSYPKERLNFMVKDAAAKLLIADEELRDLVDEYQGEVLLTKDIQNIEISECQHVEIKPSDRFILLYTSGSTGVPKGCQLTHGNLVCYCNWYWKYYALKPEHNVAEYASYGFDVHQEGIYPPLTGGATVHIIPEELRLDLVSLNDYLEREHITHTFMTTQVGYQFATNIENHSLIHMSVAGEKLASIAPPAGYQLHNGYGPTEATIIITVYPVTKKNADVPIGKPLDNVKLYVVDQQGRRLPVGALGELWAAGPQVALGYLNRPDKNAEVFIQNPFTTEEKYIRAYRTGDIVRYLPDGNIQFVGRKDGQVKIRGFRIELKEVEAVIREFPGIKDATVQAFDDENGGKFIAAYIVSDSEIDIEALNDFILDQKPPYMVPAVTMQIDAIPLNQNQKVNKKALPKPVKSAATESQQAIQAPMNVLEQELHEMIAGIINHSDFGITTVLGFAGLTSISAIKLAVQVNKRYGITLDAKSLVKSGTLQSIENEILEQMLNGQLKIDNGQLDSVPHNSQLSIVNCQLESAPLSFAQQGVFTECQANPDAVQYNIPIALHFPKEIGEEQLADAVRKVVDAHPYILCHFVADGDNGIIQEPIPDFTLDIPVKTMTADELEAYKKEFVRPFDLEKGPCVRFEIVKTDKLTLLADTHHLVSDGASVDLLITQLTQALDGTVPQREDYTYYDFVRDEEITPETERFFEQQMAEVEEPTQLIPDVFVQNLPHIQKSVFVATDIQAVKAFAQKNGITPAAVYLGASFITFGRYVCEDLVSIVTVSNGRSNIKVWNTMGMFVNTLPLVTTLDNHEKTADFLRRVSQNFSDTIEHENYPFARIASRYDFHPQISYAYQIGVLNDYRTKYGAVEMEGLALELAKLPVAVYIVGTEGDARIKVDYDTALFSEEMMTGLAKSIDNVVSTLMESENLSEVSLTGKEEWKMLDSFNADWDLDFDKTDTVVSVFRRNAKNQPDKVAAVFKDKAYTYRELDKLTDQLAAKLYAHACQATGKTVLAEEVISILLNRNENVFILPLAAVKAGLAYEPLDPSYPKERLNFMVKDAGACLLVAEESLLGLVDEYEGPTVTVEELYASPDLTADNCQLSIVNCQLKPSDLLIMLYTSGSTGLPKGCQIEHRNMVAYAHGVRNDFYRRDDRIAAYASFGFDVNMSDVFCTLLNGGTVYLIPEEIRMNLDALARYFDEAGITALLLTTQVGVQFLQNYPQLKTLRMLVMGGEKLPAVDPSRLSYTIVNGYGPTENCCGVSLFPIRAWEPNIPIGKPMATIHGYVLDKSGHRLPAGAAGEYCLSGPQVSRGYLNRPDKTAEAYESSPFDEFRMYHTGDIVRYRQNGDVEFVGRKDGQVKIRGFRIETKEVEAVIRGFSGISDVTVQAYDYEGGGKYLAAFVVSNNTIDIDALREFIKSQKPAYMVPAAIVQIEKIPLTVNQKVDKKALPEPRLQKAAYVAPKGKTEKDFCAIFEEVLGVERVSAEDDFFEVGGNSILAMKVVIAAEKAGYSIVYNDVFSYTTPRLMAEFLGAGSEESEETSETTGTTEGGIWVPPVVGSDKYDYTQIHELLSHNTIEAFRNGEHQAIGDVLLLGATGYLGSHVLHELIVSHNGKIYCLVRPGKEENGQARLKAMQRYYFGDNDASIADALYDSRIIVIDGDATDPASLEQFEAPHSGMTVINCAASVKHFAKGNEIDRVNVESVKNLTAWCLRWDARLVHISTGSIMGSRKNGLPPTTYRFNEQVLYAGQEINFNQYVHSKFMAERHIYEEILEHGLKAKVMRVGNLAPRAQDGEFQINYSTNTYMNSLQAYQALGFIPYDALVKLTEFSPIDALAKAILALATTPEDCVCFIPMNTHRPLMGDVIRVLSALKDPIQGAENETFAKALNEALASEAKSQSVSTLIAYKNNDNIQTIGLECLNSDYTNRVLERLGFSWPETGSAYIRQFIERLAEKGFFKC
ncbi:MAG: amino acid adenylation domain-containing protein [Bacteroidaceae bacterium]|nr:amino acid adenylation domain-containing protein [Bacteroidaceae bacterium]